jgi:hypothetical protein
MGTVPTRSIPSIGSYLQGLKIKDKSEKALMVRLGTLLDAVINNQRGLANAGTKMSRRSQAINAKRPAKIVGTTENVFNGVAVTIDPVKSTTGLATYEIQIDSNRNFSNPTTKEVFSTNVVFKGLTAGAIYYIRARVITKSGQAGPWTLFDSVTTTPSAGLTSADFTGSLYGETPEVHTFNFVYFSESIFAGTNFGLYERQEGHLTEEDIDHWTGIDVEVEFNSVRFTALGRSIELQTLISPLLTTDTSNVTWTNRIGEIIRYWPIALFPIFNLNIYADDEDFQANYPYPAIPYTEVFSLVGGTTSPTSIIKF